MASVEKVLYRNEEKEFLINISSYEEKYKNFLFCSSPGCNARMCYVFYNAYNYGVFRNWRDEEHSLDCEHYTEKIKGRTGRKREGEVFSKLTGKQKRNSLNRAIDLLLMSEEEKSEERRKRREKDKKKDEKKERVTRNSTAPEIKIVLDPNDENAAKIDGSVRVRLKPSKSCDRINDKDIKDRKTVFGFIDSIRYDENTATITVRNNSVLFDFKFEEAFTRNSPGALGYFHYIEKYAKEYKDVPFSGIGDIRKKNKDNKYECAVLDIESIRINKITLYSLAARYKIDDL